MAQETIKIADTAENKDTIDEYLTEHYPDLEIEFNKKAKEDDEKVTITVEGSTAMLRSLKKVLVL